MTRHRLDLFSLLSGLVLTGIALVALFGVAVDVAGWVWPSVLIAVGVVVLASVVRSDDPTDEVATTDDRPEAMAAAQAEVEEVDRTTG